MCRFSLLSPSTVLFPPRSAQVAHDVCPSLSFISFPGAHCSFSVTFSAPSLVFFIFLFLFWTSFGMDKMKGMVTLFDFFVFIL